MTRYVALLRGINVGGKNMVKMDRLRGMFEALGFTGVATYINSGNVIFATRRRDMEEIGTEIENALKDTFGFDLRIVLRDAANIESLCKAIPAAWTNDDENRTDVFFLWDEVDSRETLSLFKVNPDVDTLMYVPGAVVWTLKRSNYKKSRLHDIIGTKVYKQVTIRNVTTTRKINDMLHE